MSFKCSITSQLSFCLTLISLVSGTGQALAQTTTYVYDDDDRLVQVAKPNGVARNYTYDNANNLVENLINFTLSGISPNSGVVGSVVTITGSNFSDQTVAFNGIPATIISLTATTISVQVPVGATTGQLTVTSGSVTKSAGTFYVVVPGPSTFAPTSGVVGTQVTITGSGFDGAQVSFGGVPATILSTTPVSLTVVVPPTALTGSLVVYSGQQTQTLGTFNVTPSVSGFLPVSGLPGTAVAISGGGLASASATINSIPAPILSSTPDQLVVSVPGGATSGPLAVTVGAQTLQAGTFSVLTSSTNVLTTFSIPVASPGSTVTLFGSQFNPASTVVKVAGQTATITAITSTSVTFTVPPMVVPLAPDGSPGIAAQVSVQDIIGTAVAPRPLYLLPRITSTSTFTSSTPTSTTLSAIGDGGLIFLQDSQLDDRLLALDVDNVVGHGYLQLFIFKPDNTWESIDFAPRFIFDYTSPSRFTRTLNLGVQGAQVILAKFASDANVGNTATGRVQFTGLSTPGSVFVLHSFTGDANHPNLNSALVQASDGNFYGLTYDGGASNTGSIYRLTPQGEYTLMHSFVEAEGIPGSSSIEGGTMRGLLQASDGALYGTANGGGDSGFGTLFKMTLNGTFTVLHSFKGVTGNPPDGIGPEGNLIEASDGSLYGVTYRGGTNDKGTVFRVAPDPAVSSSTNAATSASARSQKPTTDVGFQPPTDRVSTVYSFGTALGDPINPNGLLLAPDGTLAGTSTGGGANACPDANGADIGCGTFFSLTPSTGELVFSSFPAPIVNVPPTPDVRAYHPASGVVFARDNRFWGLTSAELGSIFSIANAGDSPTIENLFFGGDGSHPLGSLLLGRDGNFYGTTVFAGFSDLGTLFRLEFPDSPVRLASFNGLNGSSPSSGVIQGRDGNFYGTTDLGGANNEGTVYRFTLAAFPLVSALSPSSGAPLTQVVITGNNLNGTTAVQFNGVNATFSVDSPTQITATVPTGATSGYVKIMNRYGLAESPVKFIVP
jgi:uncharacterized repeat protein (TIGR03803 family)/YD repeat-containing protein